jgi:hypothetical protein
MFGLHSRAVTVAEAAPKVASPNGIAALNFPVAIAALGSGEVAASRACADLAQLQRVSNPQQVAVQVEQIRKQIADMERQVLVRYKHNSATTYLLGV